MTTPTAVHSSVRTAFAALIDYAGLFPPAELPLASAQREYRAAREGPNAWILRRFIIPARRLADLTPTFDAPLAVIVDPDAEAFERVAEIRQRGATIDALEIPLQKSVSAHREQLSADEVLDVIGAIAADLTVTGLRNVPAFVEVPRTAPWGAVLAETMSALARFDLAAKIRCGGLTPDAFPSVHEVATFIAVARAADVRFKATAGLHHPLRHVDVGTGFQMHGFLNVVAAAAFAPRVELTTLEAILAEAEPGAFRFDDASFWWRELSVDAAELQRMRSEAFVSYGSCSFEEPIDDLVALGILSPQ
jgi:hypothetical protein